MRLLSRVKRLAAGQAQAAALETEAWGLVWSAEDGRFQGAVPEGSHVATDLYFQQEGRIVAFAMERLSEDPLDLGNVRSPEGELVGRVVAIEESRLVLEYDDPSLELPRVLRGLRSPDEVTAPPA